MLRKSMIALCAVASIAMLAPNLALARGGGGGGGGHGGGGGWGGGHAAGFSGDSFGARTVGGGNFSNSFARAPAGNVGTVQGNRFANANFGHMGRGGFDHGFRHGRHFFAGGFVGPYDYWDYPDYAYDDSYGDNGGCVIVQRRVHTSYGWRVRPVQVCG